MIVSYGHILVFNAMQYESASGNDIVYPSCGVFTFMTQVKLQGEIIYSDYLPLISTIWIESGADNY